MSPSPHDKLAMPWTELGCAASHSCRKPGAGFPSGMCTSNCDADRACRNDYVCARTGPGQAGACVPAYFLFQLRVDGHPPPG